MDIQNDVRYVFKKKDNIYIVVSGKNEIKENEIKFTATVIDILCNENTGYRTLRVKNMIYEKDKEEIPGMVTMPYDWIESAKVNEN